MNRLITLLLITAILQMDFAFSQTNFSFYRHRRYTPYKNYEYQPINDQKIQIAILLDVSNSMDGLLHQAKAQLWNMVNTVGRTRCNGYTPRIEIALYEYGRSTNSYRNGYVRQLTDFTSDLDKLSYLLFGLTTNGGEEFCSEVIMQSLMQLKWDNNPNSYKAIFIAGNEDFRQGRLNYRNVCAMANQKNVIINTIYCGDRMQGIREHWNINDECGGGSFSNIDQNMETEDMATPYDDEILSLNEQLNNTYLYYGDRGLAGAKFQQEMDQKNRTLGKSVAIKRTAAKSNKAIYNNESWDLVDKLGRNKNAIEEITTDQLPDSLRNKSKEEIKSVIITKQNDRTRIQREIAEKITAREKFIANNANKNSSAETLETEIEKTIRTQTIKKGMKLE